MSQPLPPSPDRSDLVEMVRKSVKAFNALPKERQAELRHAQRKSWIIGETMLSHPEMTREQAEALYAKVDPTDTLIAAAYERGLRDENEACAKVADEMSGWMQPRDVAKRIRARSKKGASDE